MHVRGSIGGRRAAQALAATGLVVAATLGATALSGTATAATTTFNPFSANRGFTMVVRGDAQLGNSELEGSIAVLGSVSSAKQNGYALPHVVAGRGDYAVPLIDGTPVRILADRFVGGGGFDVSNAGAAPGTDNAGRSSRSRRSAS